MAAICTSSPKTANSVCIATSSNASRPDSAPCWRLPSPGAPRQGSSQLTAVKLQGVTAKDLEKFLFVFYNPCVSLVSSFLGLTFNQSIAPTPSTTPPVSDWACILHLGHEWQFPEVIKLAVRELEKMPMPVVDRIALYQEHKVAEDLLIPHYAALCTRGCALDLDESERLGMPSVVLINQTMHSIHVPRDANGCASPIDPTNAVVISKIIAHIGKRDTPVAGSAGVDSANANDTQKRAPNGVNGVGGKPKTFGKKLIANPSMKKVPRLPSWAIAISDMK
ncbi:hypothetical protein MSAN_00557000 [Mycena sanguinolenta]|uniref:Uncharacterized protein n=1 Tax=Mycena sanguinolenta TaxID=230812 RepID=A0A8H6Z6I3_9AGAR|nr:hypothetical protein MSAN_00557000 [Mycena sanguinolenta]